METELIDKTKKFIYEVLASQEGSHDWWHIKRVWSNAKQIQMIEGGNRLVIELAALLHDIADYKHHKGDEEIGARRSREWLLSCGADVDLINQITTIISSINYAGPSGEEKSLSLEHAIVQDADRLDALGAIGIGRVFTFGGHFGRPMYNPNIRPNLKMDKTQYKLNQSASLNHFFEKLFHLKDRMLTDTGRTLALARHQYMIDFVRQFLEEWGDCTEGDDKSLLEMLDCFAVSRSKV